MNDFYEVCGLKARSADQSAVYVILVHQIRGICGLYASAVLYRYLLGDVLAVDVLKDLPYEAAHVLSLLGACGPSGAYGPDGLVGYGHLLCVLGGNSREDRAKAQEIGNAIKRKYPSEPVYVHFYSPRWTCRIGNYRTYEEASHMLKNIRKMGYKEATILRGKITVQY